MPIARVERDFVIQGAMCGARPDGRSNFDTRQVTLETGIINQASGSCRLKIAGGTHVLVGIKVQVGDVIFKGSDDKDEAFVNANNVGRIESFVEW